MKSCFTLASEHADVIQDISIDWHGNRLASCSVDRDIKIWDRVLTDEAKVSDTSEGETHTLLWKLSGTLPPVHTASVTRISWAHPEFGQILASCSSDQSIVIYEEILDKKVGDKKWVRQASLTVGASDITDIRFSPYQTGLKLACCSKDGFIRIFEAFDVMNLGLWHMEHEFKIHGNTCLALSFNCSPFESLQIAVGTDQGFDIWEHSEELNAWRRRCFYETNVGIFDVHWAPDIGRPFHRIAVSLESDIINVFEISKNSTKLECVVSKSMSDHGNSSVCRVLWNSTGNYLAIADSHGGIFNCLRQLDGSWLMTRVYQCP